jgi:Tfp pilus assembly protein PilX
MIVMITIKKKIKKSNKKRILFNQKGMALITTLIFIFILVTFVVALLTMTSSDSRLSTLQRESTRAFYLADAGIEEAFWKLNTAVEDGGEEILTWRPTVYPEDPGTATEYYQVTIENTGTDDPTADPPTKVTDKIKITSTGVVIGGKFSSGKRKIEVTAEIDYIYKTVYDYAILAEKIILFQGTPGPDVVGDVHSNDDILVSGHFADNYPEGATATCSGDTNDINSDNTGAENIDLPYVDYPKLKLRAEYQEDFSGIIHYHDGDVILGKFRG